MSNAQINRFQLSQFIKDPKTIKAFENLFVQSTQTTITDVESVSISADNAMIAAQDAQYLVEKHKKKIKSITASYSAPTQNISIFADATAGNITVTMPLASTSIGNKVSITKTDVSVNTVTITRSGSNLIAGEISQVLVLDGEYLEFISDGTNWQIGG